MSAGWSLCQNRHFRDHAPQSVSSTPLALQRQIISRVSNQTGVSLLYIEGFRPEWCITTMYHAWDTPILVGNPRLSSCSRYTILVGNPRYVLTMWALQFSILHLGLGNGRKVFLCTSSGIVHPNSTGQNSNDEPLTFSLPSETLFPALLTLCYCLPRKVVFLSLWIPHDFFYAKCILLLAGYSDFQVWVDVSIIGR